MDSLEFFPADGVDTLLAEVCRIFEYEDVPLTQEMVDRHFIKLHTKDFDKLDFNSQQLTLAILALYEDSLFVHSFYIYIRSGPHVYFENNVLKFPKIIARLSYG